jgi:hypothetical protein
MQGKKYATEEERKEATRQVKKRYAENNKDKIKQRQRLANKKFRENNKEKCNLAYREWYKNGKDGKWRVYLLPNIMYVGQTSTSIVVRMNNHKYIGNDTTDYIILHICNTKQEALQLEKIYHDIGFNGRNPVHN